MAFIDNPRFSISSLRLSFKQARDLIADAFPKWFKKAPENKIYLLPAPKLPEKFEFTMRGITAKGRRFLIPNAKRTLFFSLGHGGPSVMYRHFAKILNRLKFNVVLLELPRPENGKSYKSGLDIMTGYQDVITKALFNRASPMFEDVPPHHRPILLTHSTSGLAVERIVKKNKIKAEFALRNYSMFIHGSTLFDTAGSAENYNRIGNAIFLHLADYFPKNVIGLGKIDKKYLSFMAWYEGKEVVEAPTNGPLYEEGKAIKLAGIELVKDVRRDLTSGKLDENSSFVKIPRLFLAGDNDKASDRKTIQYYADMMGQKFMVYEGQHCFLTQATAPLFWIIDILKRGPENYIHRPDAPCLLLTHAATSALPVRAPHAV
jgi:hypothetical protein